MPAPIVPPLVLLQRTNAPAYLLEWQEVKPGRWGALVQWVEWLRGEWTTVRETVPAGQVAQLPGQNYKGVPRMGVNDLRIRSESQGRQSSR